MLTILTKNYISKIIVGWICFVSSNTVNDLYTVSVMISPSKLLLTVLLTVVTWSAQHLDFEVYQLLLLNIVDLEV